MTKSRLSEIDIAKGIGIGLVVLGHVVAREPPAGNEWYVTLKMIVYKFHMPFFMFLAGVVFAHTTAPQNSVREYVSFLKRKALRLLPGFLMFSILIWGGKLVASRVVHVDNAGAGTHPVESLLLIVVNPTASVAASLWFIYVLFLLYLSFPLLLRLFRGSVPACIAIGATLHLAALTLPIPNTLALRAFCEYSLYFAVGIAFSSRYESAASFIGNNTVVFIGLFLSSLLTIPSLPEQVSKTVVGLAAIPAFFGIASWVRGYTDRWMLLTLGSYSLSIYLMNTMFIGLAKGLMFEITHWHGTNFVAFFFVLFAAGLIGPLLMQKYVLSRLPLIGRVTR